MSDNNILSTYNRTKQMKADRWYPFKSDANESGVIQVIKELIDSGEPLELNNDHTAVRRLEWPTF